MPVSGGPVTDKTSHGVPCRLYLEGFQGRLMGLGGQGGVPGS